MVIIAQYIVKKITGHVTIMLSDEQRSSGTILFTILKKCCGKFECLIYETLFIQEKKPELNTQSDSIKAKLFSVQFYYPLCSTL